MAIELYEKIDLAIKTEEKKSVYHITVKLEPSPEDKEALERFKEEIEAEYKEIMEAADRSKLLSKKITRLEEDIEDITEEIEEIEVEDDLAAERKALRAQRRRLRCELRETEDELLSLEERFDLAAYTDAKNKIVEDVARKSFDINVVEDEKKEALESAIARYGIKYSVIVREIGRLIEEAKKKKKKRS